MEESSGPSDDKPPNNLSTEHSIHLLQLPYEVLAAIVGKLTATRRVALLNSCRSLRASMPMRSDVLFRDSPRRFSFLCSVGDVAAITEHHNHVVLGPTIAPPLAVYMNPELYAIAANCGHIAVMQFFRATYPDLSMAEDTFDMASAGGHVHILQYLMGLYPLQSDRTAISKTGQAIVQAAGNGHLNAVVWLIERGFVASEREFIMLSDAVDSAAKNGHLEIIQYLVRIWKAGWAGFMENCSESWLIHQQSEIEDQIVDLEGELSDSKSDNECSSIDANTSPHWLAELEASISSHSRECPCSHKAMDEAAKFGHLPVVKYLTEEIKAPCTLAALDQASGHGHLEVVQYLHKNRREGCTTKAMDFASLRGHFDVVKFLHEQRKEGCSSDALNYAASRGHLNVVKFLVKCRREGVPSNAARFAQRGGFMTVSAFLADCDKRSGGGGGNIVLNGGGNKGGKNSKRGKK
ncbi:hypothetical protein HDU81_010854 [Chytriomyces hyalinus]|nr:hypothetical protein HDU81_010854 [Chytriomyces hyalinus]